MIRVDYSGLDWKKVADATEMMHRNCGGRIFYSWKYDAHFCSLCGRWTEVKCNDAACEFCRNRPKNAINLINSVNKHNRD